MKRTPTNINRVLIQFGALRLLINDQTLCQIHLSADRLLSNHQTVSGFKRFVKLFKKRKEVHAYALSQQFLPAEGQ